MKIKIQEFETQIIIHTKNFHIKSMKKSNRPMDIISIENQNGTFARDTSLVVFLTIEKNDDHNNLTKMVSEIEKITGFEKDFYTF